MVWAAALNSIPTTSIAKAAWGSLGSSKQMVFSLSPLMKTSGLCCRGRWKLCFFDIFFFDIVFSVLIVGELIPVERMPQRCAKDLSHHSCLYILPGDMGNRCREMCKHTCKCSIKREKQRAISADFLVISLRSHQVQFFWSPEVHSKHFGCWLPIPHCFNNIKVCALGRLIHDW